jgi:hypothetical protein|tara:strand:+ start:187 stop:468 length:282 start_codon:yes stop_codon:yes gene_type:complete
MSWDELKKEKELPVKSVDGYTRSVKEETELNKHFATLFKGNEGKKVLEYLKSITSEVIAGPNITSNHLFHIEGMRFLMGIIKTRIQIGEKNGR